jgi:hypothetical protein
VQGLTGGVSAERSSGRIQRGKDISEAPAHPASGPTPTPVSSRSTRAAVFLGEQARRLACKIKTTSDFADAELQRNGKRNNRPQLQEALALWRKRKARLVIAKLDRLSRNLAFIAALIDSAVEFVAVDKPPRQPLDPAYPGGSSRR